MKRGVGVLAVLVGVGVAALGGFWFWVNQAVDAVFAQTWETHTVDFPVPFPLTEAELAELRTERAAALPADAPADADPLEGVDLEALASERAIARGKHYVSSIYVCDNCHGSDFTGGTMIDEAPIGRVLGPNLTLGSRTKDFTVADWDRAVRHGVLPGGATSVMPVGDFRRLSDRELSDIVAYIKSLPAKPAGERVRTWGPMGKALIAFGQLKPDVEMVPDHNAAHVAVPPPVGVTPEYGDHIAQVCTGCHRSEFNGGPMPFGPPDWPPAANLTPSEAGLAGWTFEDFEKLMRRGMRKNGEAVRVPMSEMLPYGANMTETELRAIFLHLQAQPPLATGL